MTSEELEVIKKFVKDNKENAEYIRDLAYGEVEAIKHNRFESEVNKLVAELKELTGKNYIYWCGVSDFGDLLGYYIKIDLQVIYTTHDERSLIAYLTGYINGLKANDKKFY